LLFTVEFNLPDFFLRIDMTAHSHLVLLLSPSAVPFRVDFLSVFSCFLSFNIFPPHVVIVCLFFSTNIKVFDGIF